MKILQICARIPFPVEDGGSVYVFNTTKYLQRAGHEISTASFYSEIHNQDPKGFAEYCTLFYEKGNFKPYTLPAVLRAFLTRQSVNIQHRMNPAIMDRILHRIPGTFDVVILEGLHTARFLPLVRNRFPGVKTVLRSVNVEHELIAGKAGLEKNFLKRFFLYDQASLLRRFEIEALNDADALTFISEKDYTALQPFIIKEKPFLINPPGVELQKEIPFSKREKNHLIAFSNWQWHPNSDGLKWFISEVWPRLTKKNPGITLTIAGNSLPDGIRRTLPHNITYTGFANDLHSFNARGALQIVPLISGSGVKIKVIEGLGYGNPVVSTSFGTDGIKAVPGRHYELANTPEDFAEKVLILLSDEERRRRLGAAARRLVAEHYLWENKIGELETFLKTTVIPR